MRLTLDARWLDPGHVPESFPASPFFELPHDHRWKDVYLLRDQFGAEETDLSLEEYAAKLVRTVEEQLTEIRGPVTCLLSGGYDSRLIAALLERHGIDTVYWTDAMERPESLITRDMLNIPEERRRVWPMEGHDPYGVSSAQVDGWAPLYFGLRFFGSDPDRTLVSGLGGGEWFSYPAAGWADGKPQRLPDVTLVDKWLDTWPHYWVLPDAWAVGFKDAVHPYTKPEYAAWANRCRREWLQVVPGYPGDLDMVRKAMLASVDDRLAGIGWKPHVYNWNLSDEQANLIDERFASSWLARTFGLECHPSLMDLDIHACRLGGFAGWCDRLIEQGCEIAV